MQQQPITFNYAQWVAAFPTFKNVSEALAQSFWDRATLMFNDCGWPGSLPKARMFLNLLTCHIAWLNAPRDASGNPASTGMPAPATVGRVSSANQGSVSVQLDMGDATAGSPSQPWYMQTTWGAEYWAGTAPFRTAKYAADPTIVTNGVYPSRGTNYGRVY